MTGVLFLVVCYILTGHFIFARSCTSQRAHDSKCLNKVYKAYIINHISYTKFLVKPNWVKIRQNPRGEILPPLDLMLILKLGPDRVNTMIREAIQDGTHACDLHTRKTVQPLFMWVTKIICDNKN